MFSIVGCNCRKQISVNHLTQKEEEHGIGGLAERPSQLHLNQKPPDIPTFIIVDRPRPVLGVAEIRRICAQQDPYCPGIHPQTRSKYATINIAKFLLKQRQQISYNQQCFQRPNNSKGLHTKSTTSNSIPNLTLVLDL